MDIDDSIVNFGLKSVETYFESNNINIQYMLAELEYYVTEYQSDIYLLEIFIYLMVSEFPDNKEVLFLECDDSYTLIDQFDMDLSPFEDVLNHPVLEDVPRDEHGDRSPFISASVSLFLYPDPPQ